MEAPLPPPPSSIVVEEWSGSSSTKLSKTATITASPSISVLRSANYFHHIWRRILEAFVPEGFPSSVTPDYVPFQVWDSLQGLSTYIRTMLSTQALLSAIGVGEKSATVIGATFQGSNLDSNAKMWRLVADLMNDLGMLMDLISPLFPSAFVFVVCLGSLSRSFTGVASGATRAALTQHFALQNNAADISAKEGSQETLATMSGMALGMLLARITMGNPFAIWFSFLALTMFHMYANYKAVQCLALTSLNPQRCSILFAAFHQDWPSTELLRYAGSHYRKAKYILVERNGIISIIMHKDSTAVDILQAFVHAHVIETLTDKNGSVHTNSQSWMDGKYEVFLQKLKVLGWKTERLLAPSISWKANWSYGPSDEKLD